MRAYFSEGEAIGDPETLARLVEDAGLSADEARSVLDGDAYAADVRAEEREAAELGISGVPFFVLEWSCWSLERDTCWMWTSATVV